MVDSEVSTIKTIPYIHSIILKMVHLYVLELY